MLESMLPERQRPDPIFSQSPSDQLCVAPEHQHLQEPPQESPQGRWQVFISPSTLRLGPLLDRLLEPIVCADLKTRLRLGLQEVLVNAVCHGNGRNPALSLRIRRIDCEQWWVFQVQDQGSGVPRSRRRASLPSDPGACAGRGLFLIHHCFDDVRWSKRGNRLQVAVQRQRPWVGQPSSPMTGTAVSAHDWDSLDP